MLADVKVLTRSPARLPCFVSVNGHDLSACVKSVTTEHKVGSPPVVVLRINAGDIDISHVGGENPLERDECD